METTMVGGRGIFFAALLGGAGVVQAADDPLAAYRWTSRVLVISAPDAADSRLDEQRTAIAAARAGMTERDLVTVEAVGNAEPVRRLRRRLGLPDDAFRVALVGKDGGIKRIEPNPLGSAALFATIDAMPMRREESRR